MDDAYDPFRPEFRRDPYSWYRRLRDLAPVHYAPEAKVWCISRYDDVQAVLRRDDVFSSRAMFMMLMNNGRDGVAPLTWPALRFVGLLVLRTWINPFTFASARNLIAEDGERHTGLRNIVNRGFTPRKITAWEQRAREIVAECLATFPREPFDVVEDLAIPLPVTIIAEMIGVERERRADFKRWSDAIIHQATGPGRETPFSPEFGSALAGMIAYVKRVARERRRSPAEDLISLIVAEQEGAAGLSDREVVQFVTLLLVAGNETTTNLIGNAVNALLRHPDQLARVIADPSLVPSLIEEVLRWDAPIQLVFRITTEEVEIAGSRIPKGAIVAPLLGSANRDERRFTNPDRFDVARDAQGHVGFGFGKHFCLGAALARLEARVALEALVPYLPRLRVETEPELVDSFLVRGPRKLELRMRLDHGAAELEARHDHDHDDHHHGQEAPSDPILRVKALETALKERGLVDEAAIDQVVDYFEKRVGPRNGAKMIAKAWTDPAYKARLLADGSAAAAELGYTGPQGEHLIAVENTRDVHNLVVCTLCSCYPVPVLGLPPRWYKSHAYRSRAVIDPRGVLRDFGLSLDDGVGVRVWDSNAELRYLVIPERPAGTEHLSESDLADLVTRDAMIGTAKVVPPAQEKPEARR